jgi:AcrR family transcriptional regulator
LRLNKRLRLIKVVYTLTALNGGADKMPKIIAKKEDWIKLGYKLFADKGIAGIIVETMAAKLKVNKSSFYWYFSTKREFIEEIVAYWIQEDTIKIIDKVNAIKTVEGQFEKLIELSFKKEPYMDFFFFLKKYAKSDKELQNKIDAVDHQRIEFTKRLFIQLGFSQSEASLKAGLFYKYLIGHHEMIRYKKQKKNDLAEVKNELNQFIKGSQ